MSMPMRDNREGDERNVTDSSCHWELKHFNVSKGIRSHAENLGRSTRTEELPDLLKMYGGKYISWLN